MAASCPATQRQRLKVKPACPHASAQPKCASTQNSHPTRRVVFFNPAQARAASTEIAFAYGRGSSGSTIYSYVAGNPISFIDPEGLLLGATFNGGRRDMSLEQAAAIGSMGNAAMVTGGLGAAGGAASAAGAYYFFGVLPGAGRTAIGLLKGISDDAMPGPTPPQPQMSTPPAIIRPGGSPPRPTDAFICPK